MKSNSFLLVAAVLGLIFGGGVHSQAAVPATVAYYQSAVQATTGLISYYTFDAGNANDSKGANVGTAGGTASFGTGVGGGSDRALTLDGFGWVDFDYVPAFDFASGQGTVELWLQAGWTDTPAYNLNIVGNFNSSASPYFNYTVSMMPDKSAIVFWNNASWEPIALPANVGTSWHHLAVVFSSTTWTLVWDGVSLATSPIIPAWPGLSGGQTQLASEMPGGSSWSGNTPWVGNLDEVAFYNTALSVSTIQSHYAAFSLATAAPVIVTQPTTNNNWYVGQTRALDVTVNPAQQPHYQWYKNSGLLSGATNSVFSVTNVVSGNAGTYKCVVTNYQGSVTSSPAVVVVWPTAPVGAYQTAVLAEPSLISYYSFDSLTADDDIGANNGALAGTAGFVTGVGAVPDSALNLDGTVSFDSLGAVPAFDFVNTNGTVELWLQAGDFSAFSGINGSAACILANWNTDAQPYANYVILMSGDKSQIIFWNPAGGQWLPYTLPANAGTDWHHLAVEFTPGSWTLVWDGQLVGVWTASAVNWNGQSGQTRLGAVHPTLGTYGTFYPWVGKMDEVAFYSNAIPVSSIQSHYSTYSLAGSAPVITKQPTANNNWYAGQPRELNILVSAYQPHYQWYKNTGLLSGATNSTLAWSSVASTDAATYKCVVTNFVGSVTSSPAVVVVSSAAAPPISSYQAACLAEPSLISYYSFDSLNAADDFGTNNGTLQGTAGFVIGVSGGSDKALTLNGVSWDNLGIVPALDFASGQGTVEMWLQCGWTNDVGGAAITPAIFANRSGTSGNANYVVMMYGDRSRIIFWNNLAWQTVPLPADPGTNWHRLAVVMDSGNWTVIWDGVNLGGGTSGWHGISGNSTQLGASLPSGDSTTFTNWIGKLDEVAFYSTALSPASIQAHYAAAYAATNAAPWNAGWVVSRLQTPQVMDGPSDRTDTPTRAFWNGSTLSKYVANGYTYNMRGADMRSGCEAWDLYHDASTSLQPGSAGSYDDAGAWLIHAEVAPENTNLVRGWYHAEQLRTGNPDRKTMAYCESLDGGRTFSKNCAENPAKNYPNNQIISAWSGYNGDTATDSAGDGRIVKVGNYYYCYFLETGTWRTHVARSLVTDHGRPGTWWKYYDPAGDGGLNGTWTEPGLGGNSSSPFPLNGVDLHGREMTWNADMTQFMIDEDAYPSPGFSGIYLNFATSNLFGGQRSPYPIYPVEGVWSDAPSWNRDTIPAKALISYRGFAALDGTTDGGFPAAGSTRFGKSFWFETSYLNPHAGFAGQRYLIRQKVNLLQTASGALQDQVGRIELGLFRHRDNTNDWATTYNTFGHYRKVQTLGYLCTANISGTAALYDLTNSSAKHLVSLNAAEAGRLSLLGYVFTNQVGGTLPLYRTLQAGIYSATTNASAPGVTGLLGYLFPPVGDETFAYRYDATEQTEIVSGGAELVSVTRTGQQGYHNWYYEERLPSGALTALTYSPSGAQPIPAPNYTQVWTSTSGANGAKLHAYGGNPGTTNSAVRRWVAIDTGIAYVSARAFSRVAAGGAGVNVLIQKNGQLLWQSTVTNGQSSAQAVSYGKWMPVTQGDSITFEIAPLSSTSKSDNTYFKPTIWFEWGSLLSSNLVSVLRVQGSTVSVQWPSSANQAYFVESCSNLVTGTWMTISPPILATPPTNLFVVPGNSSTPFYRVRVAE